MSDKDMNKREETDWERIDAMSDEMIDTSDIPPLTESFFERATLRKPKYPLSVTLKSHIPHPELSQSVITEVNTSKWNKKVRQVTQQRHFRR